MQLSEIEVDLQFITPDEALDYLLGLRGRERTNLGRIQAWFGHCARIRGHLLSLRSLPTGPRGLTHSPRSTSD